MATDWSNCDVAMRSWPLLLPTFGLFWPRRLCVRHPWWHCNAYLAIVITNFLYFFLLHISSSYAKILGEKLFRTREIPRSGSKAKDGGEKKIKKKERKLVITMAKLRLVHASTHGARKPPGPKREERLNDGNNNGQLRIAMPPRVAHAKPPGPIRPGTVD